LRRRLRIFFGVSAGVAAAFTLATSTLSYLTEGSTALPFCAGRDILLGFRVGVLDLVIFPLFSLGNLALLIAMAKGRRAIDEVEKYDLTVFELSSLRISHGMLVVGLVCLGLVAFNGLMTSKSFARYHEVSQYCQSTTAAGANEHR